MGQEVDFKLVDLREGRSDTDYRVLNGRGPRYFPTEHLSSSAQHSAAGRN
jgi:hypothetical protein